METPPKRTFKRWDVPGTARFLTFSCYQRFRLFDNDRIKDRFVEHMSAGLIRHDVRLVAWVVMPEHVHLIALPESDGQITAILNAIKNPFSREVLGHWRKLDAGILPRLRDRTGNAHFWQTGGGYDRHVVGTELLEKIRYCHSNPVKRGLSPDSVSWKWSSALAYAGRPEYRGPPIAFDEIPPSQIDLI